MCSFDRRVSIGWVLIMVVFLSSAKNAMSVDLHLHVQVTNSLASKIILSVYCNHVDFKQRLINPDQSYQWDYSGDLPPSIQPFLCLFHLGDDLQLYMFNFVTLFDSDCKQHCQWFVKEAGPCRYYESKEVCFKWLPHIKSLNSSTELKH